MNDKLRKLWKLIITGERTSIQYSWIRNIDLLLLMLYTGGNLSMNFLHQQSVESFLSHVNNDVWCWTNHDHHTLK